MKILDENNNEIQNPDLEHGKLSEEYETIHHDEVLAVEKQFHWETIAEYPNGGKDVKEVVDVEPVEHKDAYDEKVRFLRYTLFTEEELAEKARIAALPSTEERLKATEDALMAIMIGGTSNV